MRDFQGKVVLVTGASRGIGAAIAREFAARGATVAVNYLRRHEAAQAVVQQCRACGGDAVALAADVMLPAQADALVKRTIDEFGRLDVLVNNAGTTEVIPHGELEAAAPDIWRRIFDVNVIGTWQLTVAAVPHLRASGRGQVVNVSSLAGTRPVGSSIPYACSKAAVSHMTRLLANTLGPDIRVNAVAPGLVDTPWTEDWTAVREFVRAQSPMQRSATPDDVAEIILALARSTFVTGEVVLIDGGLNLR